MDGRTDRQTRRQLIPTHTRVARVKTRVRMNGTDVIGLCAAMQYGLIMLTCSSRKMEFCYDGKPVGQNAELSTVRFGYGKTETEPSDGFPQTPNSKDSDVGKSWSWSAFSIRFERILRVIRCTSQSKSQNCLYYVYVHIIVHCCSTQYSTEQFW